MRLKSNGVEINEVYLSHYIVYLTDTNITIFEDKYMFKYKYIMVECTFIKDEKKVGESDTHINYP